MSDFDRKEDTSDWLVRNFLKRHCSKHNLDFDPFIGCTKCKQEDEARAAAEKKKRTFIWPLPIMPAQEKDPDLEKPNSSTDHSNSPEFY